MEPGEPVRVVMTKWGERPHWEFDGLWLGSDEHGDWIGAPAGTHHARPGYAFDAEVDSVTLLPRDGWFCATFHAPGIWCHLYVDISTPPVLDGATVRAVDLDLDVIRLATGHTPPPAYAGAPVEPGGTYLDDEDEFAEHRVALGYPAHVVRAAEAAADDVWAAVTRQTAPYDHRTAERWLTLLREVRPRDSGPASRPGP